MFILHKQRKARRLEKQVLDLQAEIDARERIVRVLEAERDAMAAVIARDRERVKAESAGVAQLRGKREGLAAASSPLICLAFFSPCLPRVAALPEGAVVTGIGRLLGRVGRRGRFGRRVGLGRRSSLSRMGMSGFGASKGRKGWAGRKRQISDGRERDTLECPKSAET